MRAPPVELLAAFALSCFGLLVPAGEPAGPEPPSESGSFPVTIRVDLGKTKEELRPVWRFFGYDEPNYTYMKDGKKLLSELAALSPHTVYVRTHNLLTSGDGTPALKWGSTGVYSEDAQGGPHYSWTILDRIFDTYRDRGMRPYVQIGFMPEALSTKPVPYQHHWAPDQHNSISTGWAYPPKDYRKWADLVYHWVRHCIDKYGQDEVERWYWEVWNEPDIFYWRGSREEYFKLYDYAADAVKRALPAARVGGPEVTGPRSERAATFLRAFLEHCVRGTNQATGRQGSPLDFISFHAKGAPHVVNGHVQMGLAAQLQDIDRGFAIVAGFPELRDKPIVIGESDPDGCAACPATLFPQYGYRNGTLYACYTAAAFARKYQLAVKHGVRFEGAVTWAFEFEDQPYFAGFRALASNGIDLPVLNVFRMVGLMGGRRLAVESSADAGIDSLLQTGVRGGPEVFGLATLQGEKLSVLLWNYHDDHLPGPTAAVELIIQGLPSSNSPLLLNHYRIDRHHSNAFEVWKRMGSPQIPTAAQYAELEDAAQLALLTSPRWLRPKDGKAALRLSLPRQAVSLLVLTPFSLALKGSAGPSPALPFESPRNRAGTPDLGLKPLLRALDGKRITTQEAWEQQRESLRMAWLKRLGEPPAKQVKLAIQLEKREVEADHLRQLVSFASEGEDRMCAYLLLPKNLKEGEKRPAIVVFHPTTRDTLREPVGLGKRPEMALALQLTRRGYITLSPECFIMKGGDARAQARELARRRPGWTGMGKMILDASRCVDYLETLPQVDRLRIGCIGHSLGAKEVLFAMAFEPRYQAGVFNEGGIGLRMSNWTDPWYLTEAMKPYIPAMENHQVMALIAPRPFLVLGGESADGSASGAFVNEARTVYALYGASDRISFDNHKAGHSFPQAARQRAYECLDRWLGPVARE
jgi:xylan 1,4-beta-xylosidase